MRPESRLPESCVYAFPDSIDGAKRLAGALGLSCHTAELHRFPDGESLVRLPLPASHVILYRPLHDPNHKLIEIVLASAALRDQGSQRITLVAPYLPYMRQDIAFHAGEPVSQRVIGAWLARHFERIVAVEPHLHRTASLGEVFPGREAVALSSAPALAGRLREDGARPETVVIGPDSESAPLARGVAEPLGLAWAVASKVRRGDRQVAVTLPPDCDLAGRPVVIVDDVVSSGRTLIETAKAAAARGAASVEALTAHALFGAAEQALFDEAGISRIRSCDGVPHPSNAIPLAPLLAPSIVPSLTEELTT